MVEVALSCPKQLHALLKQFVPCPPNITPNTEWFSDYQKQVQALTHANTTTTKPVAHLHDRKTNTLHYCNSTFLLYLNCKCKSAEYIIIIDKVHTIISFSQSPLMKPYISCNNDVRQNVKQ